ncbi:MAG: hypothetical protein HEQ38_17080 [Gemmatimonas sp.]|nr:hypothetical protein [Gemmatimonas sp.]
MPKTQTRTALVSSTSRAAGAAATRGTLDVSAVDGGIVTFRITNGGTGPTTQCVGRILIAHKGTSMPSAAAEGTGDLDWKQVYEIGAGLAANANARGVYRFGPEVAYIEFRSPSATRAKP